MKLERVKRCNLCDSKSFEFLFFGRDMCFESEEWYPVFKCRECSLVFLGARVKSRDFDKIYPPENYGAYHAKKRKSSARLTAFRPFWHFFLRVIKGKDFWKLDGLSAGKVLDVGCASGSYLLDLKKDGWDTYGIEKSSYAAKAARAMGLKVSSGELEKNRFRADSFDVITMRSVIEHIYDPKRALREANRILKKNGVLLVETIDITSPEARLFGKNWSRLEIPRHVFFFEPGTMAKYLEKAGFKFEAISYEYDPPGILHSINYLSNKRLGGIVNSKPVYWLFLVLYSVFGRAFKIPAGRMRIKAVKA